MKLRAQPLNCTLKSEETTTSSTDVMIGVVTDALRARDVAIASTIRVAAHDVRAGVTSDEGQGDAWPDMRTRILGADILVFGTPIWLGQASSVAKRVLERMDAFLGETDDKGRMPSSGKVAVVAIVGNEDGAHAVTAQLFQALNDVGWTLPANAACYWVGEAMGKTDFQDLKQLPQTVRQMAETLASNAVHLAAALKDETYPGI
ncbi:NAD(P)H-dependent oxidoreductase [Sphingosinicella sp.]|uniref:flavodoxin family protein n=1 Tax=Sphingosinicella sp. TaxID=1917971 RepID=UPI0017EAEF64|nr:NAD(P)H-dependent oxidoreductase [Sphingosinicella sp.]MBA4758160.1 NAD(P)H-dependent oxidoreductase [Sphingosinicella sp.]